MTRLQAIGLCAVAVAAFSTANARSIVGQWEFNNNFDAVVGSPLTPSGDWAFETTTINGQPAVVARFGDLDPFNAPDGDTTILTGHNSYLAVTNPVGANGGGAFTNQYTLIMDVRFPDPTPPLTPSFISLYQTAGAPDGNDGDWFINGSNGLGISGNYDDAGNPLRFTRGEWQRIALVVDTTAGVYRSYINGQLQNAGPSTSLDGRWALGTAFYLFADEDGETQEGQVNSVQFRNYAMTASEVALLGAPTAAGIPATQPSTNITFVVAPAAAGSGCSFVDRKVTITVPATGETVTTTVGADNRFSTALAGRGATTIRVKVEGALARTISLNLQGADLTSPEIPLITTDVNCDGVVDDADLTEMILSFGEQDQ